MLQLQTNTAGLLFLFFFPFVDWHSFVPVAHVFMLSADRHTQIRLLMAACKVWDLAFELHCSAVRDIIKISVKLTERSHILKDQMSTRSIEQRQSYQWCISLPVQSWWRCIAWGEIILRLQFSAETSKYTRAIKNAFVHLTNWPAPAQFIKGGFFSSPNNLSSKGDDLLVLLFTERKYWIQVLAKTGKHEFRPNHT